LLGRGIADPGRLREIRVKGGTRASSDAGKPRRGRFDAFALARRGETLEGEVDAQTLPRLADRLVAGAQPVRWHITGGHDEKGRPQLTLQLEGEVRLNCQRCLQPMAWPVMSTTQTLLAKDETELVHLDREEPEVILAGAALDPRALVEDELLLSLPFAPRHDAGACETQPAAGAPAQALAAPAFAPLAALKSRSRSRH
jgi:uncharacterized protein